MKKAVFCLSDDKNQADLIVRNLLDSGFTKNDISVIYSDKSSPGGIGVDNISSSTTTSSFDTDPHISASTAGQIHTKNSRESQGTSHVGHEKNTKAPEGAATGAVTGGIVGGTLGLLAGIGTLAIPGVGPFIAAGPLMAALSGMSIGGGLGMVTGSLIGMGIPEYEAKSYKEKLEAGNVLLSAHVENKDEVEKAKQIFQAFGGHDISVGKEASSL